MTYQSIIRFFDYCAIDISDVATLNLSRVKKQIAAEFALQKEGFISVNQKVYNKQDVLSLLDDPNFQSIVAFHQKVDEHPALLDFLEKGMVHEEALAQEMNQLKGDEAFVRFLSPYVAPLFNKEMKRRLQIPDFEKAADWIPFCQLVLTTDGEQAFQSTTNFLEDNLRLFKNLNKDSFETRKFEVTPWTGNWARFMNWLPDLMYGIKEELSVQLINFCVEIQHADKEYCYQISKQMVALDFLDAGHTHLIRENHLVYEANVANTNLVPNDRKREIQKEKSGGTNWIWIIIAAIIFVVRMVGTCNKSEPSRDISYKYYDAHNIEFYEANNLFTNFRSASHFITSQIKDASHHADGTYGNINSYLSFMQTHLVDSNSKYYSIKLINNTAKNLEVKYVYNQNIYVLPFQSGKYIFLSKESNDNIDFVICENNFELKSANVPKMNAFFLAPVNAKGWNQTYRNEKIMSSYYEEKTSEKDKNKTAPVLECEIQIKNGTLSLQSKAFNIISVAQMGEDVKMSN